MLFIIKINVHICDMWNGSAHRSLLIHQHPGVTLLQREQTVPLQFPLRFSFRTETHGIVERFVGEEVALEVVNSIVVAVLRHIHDGQTILAG